MNYVVLTLLLCLQYITKSNGIYYWRDYQKTIPYNAYSAGRDTNQYSVYIGQAFLHENTVQGMYPTRILIGKDVYVPRYGARLPENFVQILCSTDPENFVWVPTNSTHFHLMNNYYELVRGGIDNRQWTSIGRIRYQGETVVGKVMSGNIGVAEMWFVHNGNEKKAVSFEVLMYNVTSKY